MKHNVYKWLLKKAGVITIPLLILIVINASLSVIGVNFSLVSKDAVDVATGQMPGSLSDVFIKLAVLLVIQVILLGLGMILDSVVVGRFEIRLRKDLFNKLLKKDWQKLSEYHSGELMNRLISDASIVSNGICQFLPKFISLCVTIILSAYYLFTIAPGFFVYVLPLGPLVLIFGRFYSIKIKKLHKKCQESDGRVRSFMQELLQNVIAVKSFCAEDGASEDSVNLQNVSYKLKLKRSFISAFAGIGVYIVFTVCY